ncbi:SafA/ExsA family spore coat assembly protein [Geobacillus stearothermophilus]|uniref:SafA/ExsA family spore coat assembly protein n=7 Tax=Geobacillus stearothermophilus TaxID=1422 RepID=UPI002E1AC52C|nr:SafA/ExsA family spore coat assembly protein [Geobacillus stearothermophilus]MED3753517.1 SafA/ExsA family spore coat assembly protein [Geobacillus stearothermophilus]
MKIHIVQKGDTLWKIAQKYGVDFEQLKKINGHVSDPDMIMPGMKIKVPTAGVPVKKETKWQAPPKKAKIEEHPYAEAKPFVSIDIDTEFGAVAPEGKTPANDAPANEAPKAAVKEAPKAPVSEAPKAAVKEAPKAPVSEAPKAAVKEAPKAPVSETPKATGKGELKVPVNETPNAPVNETPNVPVNEAPNAANAEGAKTPTVEPPFVHTIPPAAASSHVSFAKSLSNLPPIPPKPSNILPGIMKEETGESPDKLKGEQMEPESDEAPPLPNIPYVPVAPPPAPAFGSDQGCVPVTPILPGPGFYVPPLPAMPPYSPLPNPPAGESPESGAAPYPGISESSSESAESPPLLGPGGHGAAIPPAPPAGAAFASPGYAPPGVYAPPAGYPPVAYMPVYSPVPHYGGYAPPGVYVPPAPYGYAPQQAAPLPWPGVVYPTSPPGYAPSPAPPAASPRLFAGPPDEESEHGEEQ